MLLCKDAWLCKSVSMHTKQSRHEQTAHGNHALLTLKLSRHFSPAFERICRIRHVDRTVRPISSCVIQPSFWNSQRQYNCTMSSSWTTSSMGPRSRAPVSSQTVVPQARAQQIVTERTSRRTYSRARRPERSCLVSCAAGDHTLTESRTSPRTAQI